MLHSCPVGTLLFIFYEIDAAAMATEIEVPKVQKACLAPACAVGFYLAPQVAAQDVAAGEALYKRECRGCHGPTAKGLASYPRLVDHPLEYLVDRLKRYRAGEKFGPNTPLMAPRAKKLSDEDIVNVANFVASIE